MRFIGRVGTGFSEKDLVSLKAILAPMQTDQSPFTPALPRREAMDVTYVRPELVGEVRYGEMTSDGRLRHPSWRGLRPTRTRPMSDGNQRRKAAAMIRGSGSSFALPMLPLIPHAR